MEFRENESRDQRYVLRRGTFPTCRARHRHLMLRRQDRRPKARYFSLRKDRGPTEEEAAVLPGEAAEHFARVPEEEPHSREADRMAIRFLRLSVA